MALDANTSAFRISFALFAQYDGFALRPVAGSGLAEDAQSGGTGGVSSVLLSSYLPLRTRG